MWRSKLLSFYLEAYSVGNGKKSTHSFLHLGLAQHPEEKWKTIFSMEDDREPEQSPWALVEIPDICLRHVFHWSDNRDRSHAALVCKKLNREKQIELKNWKNWILEKQNHHILWPNIKGRHTGVAKCTVVCQEICHVFGVPGDQVMDSLQYCLYPKISSDSERSSHLVKRNSRLVPQALSTWH